MLVSLKLKNQEAMMVRREGHLLHVCRCTGMLEPNAVSHPQIYPQEGHSE